MLPFLYQTSAVLREWCSDQKVCRSILTWPNTGMNERELGFLTWEQRALLPRHQGL